MYRHAYYPWMIDFQLEPDERDYDQYYWKGQNYRTHPWHSVPYYITPAVPYGITHESTLALSNYTHNQFLQGYPTAPEFYQEWIPASDIFNTPRHFVTYYVTNESRLVSHINHERRRAGAGRLAESSPLSQVAAAKAKDMANIGSCPASHYSATYGGDEGTMLKNAGITAERFGWIIYCGQPGTYSEAVNWWMNISTYGHRETILNPIFRRIGVGSSVGRDGRRYWSVIFSS